MHILIHEAYHLDCDYDRFMHCIICSPSTACAYCQAAGGNCTAPELYIYMYVSCEGNISAFLQDLGSTSALDMPMRTAEIHVVIRRLVHSLIGATVCAHACINTALIGMWLQWLR